MSAQQEPITYTGTTEMVASIRFEGREVPVRLSPGDVVRVEERDGKPCLLLNDKPVPLGG